MTTLARALVSEAMWIESDDLGFGALWCFSSNQKQSPEDVYFLSIDNNCVMGLQQLPQRPACESLGPWPRTCNQVFPFPATAEARFELAAKLLGDKACRAQTCAYGDDPESLDTCLVLVHSK